MKNLGMTVLVFVAIGILSTMTNTFTPLEQSYKDYYKSANQEDLRFVLNTNEHETKIEKYMKENGVESPLSAADLELMYANHIAKSLELSIEHKEIKEFQTKEADTIFKYIFTTKGEVINTPKIVEGRLPEKKGEISVNKSMLYVLNKAILDQIDIRGEIYTIVGTYMQPDYVILNDINEAGTVKLENHFLILTTEQDFKEIQGDTISFYAAKQSKAKTAEQLQQWETKLENDDRINVLLAKDNPKINTLQQKIEANNFLGLYFGVIITGIAMIALIFMLKREVRSQLKILGVFKANGYNLVELMTPYLIYPIIIGGVGSIIGYLFGYMYAGILRQPFMYLFNVPTQNIIFPLATMLGITVILTGIVASILAITILQIIRKKTSSILQNTPEVKKSGLLKKLTSKINVSNIFMQLNISFLIGQIKKISAIIIAAAITSILLFLAVVQFNLVSDTQKSLETQMDYKYAVLYNQAQNIKEEPEISGQRSAQAQVKFYIDKTGLGFVDTGEKVSLNALELGGSQYINLLDENKISVIDKIKDNNVVVSSYFKQLYDIKVGSNIKVEFNNQEITLRVAGIVSDAATKTIYGDLTSDFFKKITSESYTTTYTNSKPAENKNKYVIIDVSEYIENSSEMARQLQNGSLSIGVAAIIIAFVIFGLVFAVSFEENKGTIALLKLMGYTKREINHLLIFNFGYATVIGTLVVALNINTLLKQVEKQIVQSIKLPALIEVTNYQQLFVIGIVVCIYIISLLTIQKRMNKIDVKKEMFEE
ncbi:MAG: FtsX-like permease family protein [Culicoidibacterales bacterium]